MLRTLLGTLRARWEHLSTGLKMLLILGLGLAPLGAIAILASIYNARENSEQRAEQTLARLDIKAQRLNELIARSAGSVRAAAAALAAAPPETRICERTLQRLSAVELAPARYALFDAESRQRCASAGFTPDPPAANRLAGTGSALAIDPSGKNMRMTLYGDDGTPEGVVEFDQQTLSDFTLIPGGRTDFNLTLIKGDQRMPLRSDYRQVPFVQTVTDDAPIADGRLQLRIELGSMPVRPIDVIIILLPVMMWLAASFFGWLIVNRYVLTPLAQIHKAVAAYRPGDRALTLPSVSGPAREIAALGEAFDQATRTVARHEADLEAAVERQTRLVREVHHRVKNNLQVVASLLNLHSRGAANEEVAAAYASIQRRVDALAVVHRNHYAELEENCGVALKPLISELAANLRATAPANAAAMQIRLDVAPLHSSQDAAVSVAFLVTEVVEFGMLCGGEQVTIVLDPSKESGARLSIEVDSLAGEPDCDEQLLERFDRIITGLARQLRSALDRDPARGRYCVTVQVVD